jgi:hypothetical protein
MRQTTVDAPEQECKGAPTPDRFLHPPARLPADEMERSDLRKSCSLLVVSHATICPPASSGASPRPPKAGDSVFPNVGKRTQRQPRVDITSELCAQAGYVVMAPFTGASRAIRLVQQINAPRLPIGES